MLPYKKYRSAGYSWKPRQFERQFLNREADYEIGDYYWYWSRPCEIEVMDIEREQEYWEQDNVRYIIKNNIDVQFRQWYITSWINERRNY